MLAGVLVVSFPHGYSFGYAELHATFPPIVSELLELPRWACMKNLKISCKTHSTIVLHPSDASAAALIFFFYRGFHHPKPPVVGQDITRLGSLAERRGEATCPRSFTILAIVSTRSAAAARG